MDGHKEVPMDLIVELLQYLAGRPLAEVNDMFHALNRLPVIQESEVPDGEAAD
jgi:hypothetical protein